MAIGAWHARAHITSCLKANSARYREGTGLTSGDNIEHLWAAARPHCHALKYKSPAAWQDLVLAVVGKVTGHKGVCTGFENYDAIAVWHAILTCKWAHRGGTCHFAMAATF